MTPEQAAQEWASGRLKPVYYLVGEDGAARAAAVQRIKDAVRPDPFNLSELDAEAVEEAVSAANAPPVFAERRLVVLRGPRLPAEARRALAAYLEDPLASTTLVLQSEDRRPDPKDALAAAAGRLGGLVTFEPLGEDEAAVRLLQEAKKAGVELEPEAAAAIVEEAGTHWGVLRAELEKLLLYAKGRARATREDALACLGYRQAANPFALPDLVLGRKRAEALSLLDRLLEEGISEFQLLSKLSYEFNRLLKARRLRAAGVPEPQLFRELRLHSYYGREFLRRAEGANEGKLVRSLKACVETEANLKSKSWLEPRIELERLVAVLTA